MIIIEGLVVCLIILTGCVIGIANGPENLIFLYEKEVQERAVQNGTITKEKIRKNAKLFKAYGMGIAIAFTLIAVYGVNGARGFAEGFWQILVIWLVEGVFDRFFIDWYWVNHTKAWIIEGTEDLRPYIPRNAVVKKWLFTIVVSPLMAVILSGAMLLFAR